MKKKLWETRVGFTIDGATVWQFVNFFVVPSIEQRCSNVGKKKKKYNIFSRESPPTANSGQQPFYFVFGSFKCRNLRVFYGVNGIEKGKGIEKGGVLEWRVL